MARVNPGFVKEIKKFGALDTTACFNCGNCTAVCPLSKEDASFPRKLIRYAHLGLKDRILKAKEPWLCYYCGECSKTCPREAKPAAFMAAARRYSIASNDLTGLTGLLYKNPALNFIFMTAMALYFAFFMYANRLHGRDGKLIEVFNIPYEIIHTLGIILIVIASATLAVGLLVMAVRIMGMDGILKIFKNYKNTFAAVKTAWNTVMKEMFAFKRFRECDEDKIEIKWYLKPWFLHAMTAWGFMGLFGATIIDFAFKDPELLVPLWYPARLLGIVSGIMLMYGTSVIIYNRLAKNSTAYTNSDFTDWWFILTLWFVGVTGFILTVLVYLPATPQPLSDILFIIHVAPAMQLVVMAAFTKLAHVFYRTFALFAHNLQKEIG